MAAIETAPVAPPTATTRTEGILRRQWLREPAARTYARSLPVVPVRARGLTIECADGRRYLDCASGAGTLVLGHNHPVVLEAVKRVIDSEEPLHAPDLASPVKDTFTTELFATLPDALARDARIRFCGPAAPDAVGAALALARAATGRTGILSYTGHEPDPAHPAPDVTRLPFPRDDRSPAGEGEGGGQDLTALAGVLVEAVRHEGGVLPAPDGWLRRMRAATEAGSAPLIADETHTGVGRTGTFWAVEHSGVVPDVMVMGKAIGGSLPLAVIVYRSALDRPVGPSQGNQLAMAAGAATLAYVRRNRLAGHAAELGARMLARLRADLGALPWVRAVHGRGLMIGLELDDPSASGGAVAVRQECLKRGLIVDADARSPGTVRLLPPLTLTPEQAEAVLERFADALAAVDRTGSGRAAAGAGLA
ncbi:aspartate aminotransferase family protein [Streptomyces sp. CC53]|uniref:aminotransferase class III-fold pyridoxal phosphate-dependent enzyme n=1 Tax=unclassified Streptomyces TaxID=2593676 RepID=UPI0008DCB37C|nr:MULTISPECIES: aminotransferase class III-fold pyridoxal phosphate-dependent enzyme [unclassified Streptomyces]OII63463.1 aspartate aminotransferase family protein [Streptomyces sp. CC53]